MDKQLLAAKDRVVQMIGLTIINWDKALWDKLVAIELNKIKGTKNANHNT